MIRVIPMLLFTAIAILLFVALIGNPENSTQKASGPLLDQPLQTLPLVNAESMPAELKPEPGRVMLLNFLASWCTPCAAEMGELVALKNDAKDALFVGIAWNDAPITIGPWLEKHGDPFDVVRYDPGGRAAIALGLRGIPETYIVDAEGIIRYQLSGPLTQSVRENEVKPLLRQLLKEAKDAR